METKKDISQLVIHTIYNHPPDYPNNYVLRKFFVKSGDLVMDTEVKLYTDLKSVRKEMLANGLTHLPKQPGDSEYILETWI